MIVVSNINLDNNQPFVLFRGLNVLEDIDSTLFSAAHFAKVCRDMYVELFLRIENLRIRKSG